MLFPAFGWDTQGKSLIMKSEKSHFESKTTMCASVDASCRAARCYAERRSNRCFTHVKADADDKSGVDAGPNNAE